MEQALPNDAELIMLPISFSHELADGEHILYTTEDQVSLRATAAGGKFVAWRVTDSQGNQSTTKPTRFAVCGVCVKWGERGRCLKYVVMPCYLVAD